MKNGPLVSYAAYLRSAERSPAKRVRGSAGGSDTVTSTAANTTTIEDSETPLTDIVDDEIPLAGMTFSDVLPTD